MLLPVDEEKLAVPLAQMNSMSVEMRTGKDEGGTHISVTNFESTPIRGPAESSDQGSGSRSESETFDTGLLEKDPQEDSASIEEESDHMPSDVVNRPCEVINTVERGHSHPLREQEPSALQPTDATNPNQQEDVSVEENHTGLEPEAEYTRLCDNAAPETIALMGEQSEPLLPKASLSQGQRLQPNPPHESMSEDVTLDSEAFSYPTTDGRFIPAITEKCKERYCTNTDIDDEGTIVGRIASLYAARLREMINTARKHHDDHIIQEYNELKIEWLEKTQWANISYILHRMTSIPPASCCSMLMSGTWTGRLSVGVPMVGKCSANLSLSNRYSKTAACTTHMNTWHCCASDIRIKT